MLANSPSRQQGRPNIYANGRVPVWMLSAEPFPGRDQITIWWNHNEACRRVRDWVLSQDALVIQCNDLREERLPGDYSDQRYGNGYARKVKCHDIEQPYWSPARLDAEFDFGHHRLFEQARGVYGKARDLAGEEREPGVVMTTGQEIIAPAYATNFKAAICWCNNNLEHAVRLASMVGRMGHTVRWMHWDGSEAQAVALVMDQAA